MESIKVKCSCCALVPHYSSIGAAGADVRANILTAITINPGEYKCIETGVSLNIPPNLEVQVRPRSGLALNHGISILNSPGTIDSDYRGEIKILVINHGNRPFIVRPGMKIAQLVVSPVIRAKFIKSSNLGETDRGECGFGSTGV